MASLMGLSGRLLPGLKCEQRGLAGVALTIEERRLQDDGLPSAGVDVKAEAPARLPLYLGIEPEGAEEGTVYHLELRPDNVPVRIVEMHLAPVLPAISLNGARKLDESDVRPRAPPDQEGHAVLTPAPTHWQALPDVMGVIW